MNNIEKTTETDIGLIDWIECYIRDKTNYYCLFGRDEVNDRHSPTEFKGVSINGHETDGKVCLDAENGLQIKEDSHTPNALIDIRFDEKIKCKVTTELPSYDRYLKCG